MALYSQVDEDVASWPEPIESIYQLLGGGEASALAPKLPHLGLADILFMTLVMCLPKERRHGASSPGWLGSFCSRVGITARTVRHWRAGGLAFREREQLARQEGIAHARQFAQAAAATLLSQAITTLAEILYDSSVPFSVRASVAMRVMTWCGAGNVGEEEIEQDRWAILLRELHTSANGP